MKKLFITLITILLCINVFAQQNYYSQAAKLIDNGEYEQAVNLLTQSIEAREKPEWIPYYLRAIAYANSEKFTSALDDTEKALQKINLDNFDKINKIYTIYSLRALIFKLTENFDNAISEMSIAIKYAPSKDILQNLILKRANYYYENSNYKLSIKDYEKVLKQDTKNLTAKLSIVRSIVSEQEENYSNIKPINTSALKRALTLTNEIIASKPDYDMAYKFRVRTYALMKKYPAAINDAYAFRNIFSTIVASVSGNDIVKYAEKLFFQCVSFDTIAGEKILLEKIDKTPNNPLPYYLLALLYANTDNYQKGIEMLTQSINKTDRELNELLILRSKFYYSNKDYDNALTDLHIAKQQNDSNAYIFYLEGTFYNKIENWNEAAKSFGEVIRIKPNISDGYIMRSNAYQKLKNFDLAKADLDSALKLDTTDVEVLVPYAYFYMEKGDRKASNEVYQKVLNIIDSIETYPKFNDSYSAMIYNNMAYNYVKLGDYEQAEKYVEKALQLDDESGYIWDTRGELYFWQKKYKECISDMNKAIELRKDNEDEPANSYFYRGRAKLELGQTEDGNADIQKAADLKHKEAIEFVKTKN